MVELIWCHFLFILITVLNYFNVINLNAISIVTHSKSLRFPSNNKLIYEFTEVEVTADLHLTQDVPVGLGEFYVEFLWSLVICLILTSHSLLFFLFTYNINFKRVFIQWKQSFISSRSIKIKKSVLPTRQVTYTFQDRIQKKVGCYFTVNRIHWLHFEMSQCAVV